MEEKLGDYRENTKSQKSQGGGEIISNVPSGFCVRDLHKILLRVLEVLMIYVYDFQIGITEPCPF